MPAKKWTSIGVIALVFVFGGTIACQSQTSITVNTQPVTQAQLDIGQEIYNAHCAECHGANGEGEPNWQTPNDDGIFPAPPHTSQGHTWHHPDQHLLEIIAGGGAMPNSPMPGFADTLSQEDMIAVLGYIKSFWEEEELMFQTEATNNLLSQ